ncbi:MAG: acyl carrier protein [Clostridia bacterium]|nr:acyl carrier protein [Clostridia bacterium]
MHNKASYRKDEVFCEPIHVPYHECDGFRNFRLSALLAHMSTIAGEDYDDRGFPHDWLWDNGMVFLVSRLALRVIRNIKKDEEITLATYERGLKGATFNRNYEFIDADGNTAVECKSVWILCNPETRMVLKPKAFPRTPLQNWDKLPDCPEAERLKMPNDAEFLGDRRIVLSDIDWNGHLFNAYYCDISLDFLPLGLVERGVRDLVINFQHEAVLGDSLKIYGKIEGDCATVYGIKEGENTPCYICRFTFGLPDENI